MISSLLLIGLQIQFHLWNKEKVCSVPRTSTVLPIIMAVDIPLIPEWSMLMEVPTPTLFSSNSWIISSLQLTRRITPSWLVSINMWGTVILSDTCLISSSVWARRTWWVSRRQPRSSGFIRFFIKRVVLFNRSHRLVTYSLKSRTVPIESKVSMSHNRKGFKGHYLLWNLVKYVYGHDVIILIIHEITILIKNVKS